MAVQIAAFVEGETEKAVLAKLIGAHDAYWTSRKGRKKLANLQGRLDANDISLGVNDVPHRGTGKDSVLKTLDLLSAYLQQDYRCLLMFDQDDGDTIDAIKSVCEEKIKATRSDCSFQPTDHPNVYLLQSSDRSVRVAMHVAAAKHKAAFVNTTTDDYLLSLLLQANSTMGFWQRMKDRASCREKPCCPWPESTDIKAVCDKAKVILEALEDSSLPNRLEAKMYLHVCALIAREISEPWRVNEMILAGADPADLNKVFSSHIAAIKYLL